MKSLPVSGCLYRAVKHIGAAAVFFGAILACEASAKEFTIPLAQELVDGAKLGVQPGDTILLEAGPRTTLRFEHVVGSPTDYVTIRNKDGEVLIRNDNRHFDIFIGTSRYFHLTGEGKNGVRYGIQLAGTMPLHGSALMISGLSSDCEVDHLEIHHPGFAGMLVKTDGAVGTTMDNISIHDNFIHDTGGEGMYVGETKIPGQLFHHVKIFNNVVARSGYEACQVCNIIEDCQIHNNVFYRCGQRGDLWQDRGVQLAHSACEMYGNIVMFAHSVLLVGSGGPTKFVHDNYFEGTVSGPGVEFGDAKVTTSFNTGITIEKNYFRGVSNVQPVILFTGEETELHASNNVYQDGCQFLQIQPIVDLSKKVFAENNRRAEIQRPQFVDEAHDNFALVAGDPYKALGMGLK